MYLGGQANQRGYAMAALLVAIAVMAVVMSALLPAWRQQAQREKEAELVFRGEQYARAIYLFQRKNGGMYPPNIDTLVDGRYIRKKYKDPMTEDGEFQPIFAGQQPQQPGPGRGGVPTPGGTQTVAGSAGRGRGPTPPTFGGGPATVQSGAGLLSVRSKSKEASIRIYNGGAHYNEWNFVYRGVGRGGPQGGPGVPPGAGSGRPGMPGPGRGTGPGRGGPGRRGGPRGGPGGGFGSIPGPGRGRGPG